MQKGKTHSLPTSIKSKKHDACVSPHSSLSPYCCAMPGRLLSDQKLRAFKSSALLKPAIILSLLRSSFIKHSSCFSLCKYLFWFWNQNNYLLFCSLLLASEDSCLDVYVCVYIFIELGKRIENKTCWTIKNIISERYAELGQLIKSPVAKLQAMATRRSLIFQHYGRNK